MRMLYVGTCSLSQENTAGSQDYVKNVSRLCLEPLLLLSIHLVNIGVSVYALCRDDAGQISRDVCKNCLKTCQERLTGLSKLTKSHSQASVQLSSCWSVLYALSVLCTRICSHVLSRICVILFLLFFSKPTIFMLERIDRLIFSLSVSRVHCCILTDQNVVWFITGNTTKPQLQPTVLKHGWMTVYQTEEFSLPK